jgi:predicted RNase H-like HicB family nuclease
VTIPGHPGDEMPNEDVKLDIEAGRTETMKKYAVVFEKAPDNWAAYVPDLPGCVTTGPTLEETRRLIAEAIEFHIEGLRLDGEPVPEATTVAESVEVKAA